MKYIMLLMVLLFPCSAFPGVITSLSLIEKDGVTTNNYPLTFGHVFKQGDVTAGIVVKYNGTALTTQFDKKTSWADGSVKFGVVSIVIPTVTANSTGTLTIETASANSSLGAMDKTAILATDVESNINLSNISESGYSGSLSSSLRDQINSGDLRYWLQGPVCTEVLETQQVNNSLNAAWEARFYPGTSFGVRISSSLENVSIMYRGNVYYTAELLLGENSPQLKMVYPEVQTPVTPSYIGVIDPVNAKQVVRVTKENHKYETGNYAVVSGATPAEFNGTWMIKKIDNNNFAYTLPSIPSSYVPSGEITVQVPVHRHGHGSRWRKVFWLGVEPPETELHYDTDYLISTGAIIPYDTSLAISASEIALEYSIWQNGSIGIAGHGMINRDFGTTGGRREIGILPKWDAMLLLTWDNRMREISIGHSEMAGHVPRAHWRETDPTKTNYGGVVTIDDREMYNLSGDSDGGIPTAIGVKDMLGWIIDRAHMGAYGYLPYIITGDYWHLQETLFWGAYAVSFNNYGRNGAGSNQNFSSGNTYSFGLVYDPPRAIAWALRSISYAAFVALDESIESAYFSNKLNNNINWFLLANTASSHGLHALRGSREDYYPANSWKLVIATWMHDFVVLSLSDIIRKETANVTNTQTLRDRLGLFTVGRVTNHPAMNKWDGTGYVYPLAKEDSLTDYYNDGDWAKYWADCQEMNIDLNLNQGYPHTSLSLYNYADSYASIARASITQLQHLSNATEALQFYDDNLSTSFFSTNPTWALVPLETGEPINGTCGTANGQAVVDNCPSANLCSSGSAGFVTNDTDSCDWVCNGSGGGTNANCSAPYSTSTPGGGQFRQAGFTFGSSPMKFIDQ